MSDCSALCSTPSEPSVRMPLRACSDGETKGVCKIRPPLAPRISASKSQVRWISNLKDAPRMPTLKDVDSSTGHFPTVLLSFSSSKRSRFDLTGSLLTPHTSLPSNNYLQTLHDEVRPYDETCLSNIQNDLNDEEKSEDQLADEEVEKILLTSTTKPLPLLPLHFEEESGSSRHVLPMRRSRIVLSMLDL